MQMVLALLKSFHARRRGGQRGSTLHSTCPLSARKSSQHADQPGISHAHAPQLWTAAPDNEHFISLSKPWVLAFAEHAMQHPSQDHQREGNWYPVRVCACVAAVLACVAGPEQHLTRCLPFHYVFNSAPAAAPS